MELRLQRLTDAATSAARAITRAVDRHKPSPAYYTVSLKLGEFVATASAPSEEEALRLLDAAIEKS